MDKTEVDSPAVVAMICERTRSAIRILRETVSVVLLAASVLCASAGDVHAKRHEQMSHPTGFTRAELARLERGKSVKRGFELQHGGSTYQAGLSYRLVEATPMDVIRALRQPGGIVQVIPYGLSARVLSERDGISWITISQGKRPVVGTYTVRMEWDLSSYQTRFWLDPSYKADVEDIWGVFSAREIRPGATLITFGFAFRIGGVGSLLEAKAREWGLTTADRIARHVKQASQRDPM
jgi:hypothetical protein